MDIALDQCLTADLLDVAAGGARPWAPGVREEDVDIERAAGNPNDRVWCISEVDIFCDLDDTEMGAMAAAAPMKSYGSGELIYTPHQPVEKLFILKKGRIRIFRVSSDGRALTTAIVEPGTIFGEMLLVGHQMHDSFAEALDGVVVCVMGKGDVKRLLLGDARIAARISETLGRRLGEIEQRLSDSFFKSVPERIAATLATLAASHSKHAVGRGAQIKLTHEQLAALVGTSRETTTKILNEYADLDLLSLGRGRITILDLARMRRLAGE